MNLKTINLKNKGIETQMYTNFCKTTNCTLSSVTFGLSQRVVGRFLQCSFNKTSRLFTSLMPPYVLPHFLSLLFVSACISESLNRENQIRQQEKVLLKSRSTESVCESVCLYTQMVIQTDSAPHFKCCCRKMIMTK